jgi:signal transduction histidine kinase
MNAKFLKGLRFRLTFVYSTMFGFFICVFAYILSSQYLELIRHDFDAALLNFAVDITRSNEITPGFGSRLKVPEYEERKQLPFPVGSTVYVLRSIEGTIRGGSSTIPKGLHIPYLADLPESPDYTHRFLSVKHGGINYRAVNIKMTNSDGQVRILQVATPSEIIVEQKQRLILMNLLTIPFLILFSSIASYLISGNALNPIKVLTATARSIAAENLSQRVPEVETGDEVAELSRTFNNLLSRLEKSFRAQEHFVANASHQLNTPLSIIKGELDLLESRARSPEDEAKFRKSLREELERLIDLVKKLLLVSRVEAGHEHFDMRPVRIDEVLLNTTSRLSGIAREKKISIRFNIGESLREDSLVIKGDRQLLDAMFENLMENAVKYSPPETTVRIELEKVDSLIVVSVSDEGPGMSLTQWNKILQNRFKRGEGITMPGSGIGLSIVQSIAELHGTHLEFWPKESKGSKFVIAFPQQKSL